VGRVTGVGFGEHGGAGDLVYQALSSIACEWTRRGPATMLTPAFLQRTGARDIPSLIEGIELGQYFVSSDYAPVVHKVAVQGDPVALSIIQWAGRELGSTTLAVIRQLGIASLEFEVVLVGSVYDMGEILIAPMRQLITSEAPLARLVRLSSPPVVGSVLLAMEQVSIDPAPVRQRLIQSTCDLLKEKE
jgi:N-acetylglucosamine kinase-like BadF-type ATPase